MKSGFSRREVAEIVELVNDIQVGRHERTETIPTLLVALSYEAIFKTPVSELFPGLYETISARVEQRLAKIEDALHECSAKEPKANTIARKLEWLNVRKDPNLADATT